MTSPKIAVSEVRLGEEEIKAVTDVLKSGLLREGPRTRQFEEQMRVFTGAKHAIATSSGTAALHLAYLSVLKPGDEVLVPSFTFVATASMVVMVGARPVFCDIDPKTWLIDLAEVRRKITPKTKAIAGVHLFGNVCDMDGLKRIAEKHQLKIIWDAAQSLGSHYQNQDPSRYPDLTCFSFYPTKNLTTGEGGMVVTNDDSLAATIRLLKSHGEAEKYTHRVMGFNYRMSEMEAALGLVQIKKIADLLRKRKQIASRYLEYFSRNAYFETQKLTLGCQHSYNYFCIRLNPEKMAMSREEFIRSLQESGIPSAVHYPKPLHLQPCFEGLTLESLKQSEALAKQIIALPMHPYLTEEAVDYILQKIEAIVGEASHVR